jgi:predicted TIM-barrel fold metal-dependent hydrolase
MARLPFTDAHVHFFDLAEPEPGLRYAWLEPDVGPDALLGDYRAIASPRYWADDFLAETRFCGVDRVVHVQAALGSDDPVAETRWLQTFADRLGAPHGIVASADLSHPDVEGVLERHAAYANLRGIRDLRYDGYLSDPAWERGYALLERFGLVACDDPLVEHMPLARRLAARHPGVTLCLDHAGFPRRRDPDYFAAWRDGLRGLAAEANVVVKISGLGMADQRWTVESWRPWVHACLEAFGPDRCLLGTNWPVDRLFSSYGDVVDAYAELLADLTDAEQRAVFAGTANRVFRL